MIEIIAAHILPAAYAVLPPAMASQQATAMLLAIGSQETHFLDRRQTPKGSARGLWQFEIPSVQEVLQHRRTAGPIRVALERLCYRETPDAPAALRIIEHHDVLAACFARCLLWTSQAALPEPDAVDAGWALYLDRWKPGQPRQTTWAGHYADAWDRVLGNGDQRRPVNETAHL